MVARGRAEDGPPSSPNGSWSIMYYEERVRKIGMEFRQGFCTFMETQIAKISIRQKLVTGISSGRTCIIYIHDG